MEQEIEIRDKRDKEWFIVDNAYLNGYAKIFGPIGTSVYLSLCRHADSSTQECFPSMELIAEEIGISRQTVGKYISLLNDYNLIGIETKYDAQSKRRLNNVYVLINKKNWKAKPCQTNEHGSKAMLTPHAKPCTSDSESHVNPVNSNNTHIKNTHITIPSIEMTEDSFYSKEFEFFWKEYPSKVGKGKAYESWKKISKVNQALCLSSIIKQVKNNHFRGNDGREFPPHPTTWLNQRRWEDEVKEIKTYKVITD